MKTTLALTLSAATALVAGLGAMRAAEVGCSPPVSGDERAWCDDAWDYCTVTVDWTRPVDLEGDDLPDFLHRRVTAHATCGDEWAWFSRHDEIEAFYPEPQVDVWIGFAPVYPDIPLWPPQAVAPGELVGDPPAMECHPPMVFCRTWASERAIAQPTVDAQGLGITVRSTNWSPCDVDCHDSSLPGAMGVQSGDTFNETLFGFRTTRPDGWHIGWLRLQWFLDSYPIGHVELADYAIHPIPETPIAAGEVPRPTLNASVEGDEIVLSWHPAWTDYALERSASVTGAAWEDVPGVENNTVRLPKAGPPAFFRLLRQ